MFFGSLALLVGQIPVLAVGAMGQCCLVCGGGIKQNLDGEQDSQFDQHTASPFSSTPRRIDRDVSLCLLALAIGFAPLSVFAAVLPHQR